MIPGMKNFMRKRGENKRAVLAVVQGTDKPFTIPSIMAATGLPYKSVRQVIALLVRGGIIHCVGEARAKGRAGRGIRHYARCPTPASPLADDMRRACALLASQASFTVTEALEATERHAESPQAALLVLEALQAEGRVHRVVELLSIDVGIPGPRPMRWTSNPKMMLCQRRALESLKHAIR
jgi:hypothetical protein